MYEYVQVKSHIRVQYFRFQTDIIKIKINKNITLNCLQNQKKIKYTSRTIHEFK